MIEYWKQAGDGKLLTDLQHWESTGEPLTLEIAELFFETFPGRTLVNIYGGTEMMDNVYFVSKSLDEFKSQMDGGKVPLGRAVDNSVIFVMKPQTLEAVDEAEIGEICISGPALAAGYIGSHVMKSVEAFPTFENPVVPRFNRIYRTGDFGVLVNGLIYYEGRQDSQVKVRGQRVNLAEVEKVMVQTLRDYLRTVCVLVVKPRQQNQKIVAFFNLKSPICNQKINAILQNVLPAFMMPTLYQVKDFPTLVNGKIDRQALLKMYNDSLIQTFEYSDDDLKDVEAKFRPKPALF